MQAELSIVIPAYNEAGRLPRYLDAIRRHFDALGSEDYEVIVVDDGSRDGTPGVVRRLAAGWPQLALIEQASNRGKGAAVRAGMLAARGEVVLFADADGATPIGEERALREAIRAGADVAVGSRRGGPCGPRADRPWCRDLAGRGFSRVARVYLGLQVADTQCGFKMFCRDLIPALFGPCREEGYLFDLYVLGAAARMGCHLAEVPVEWKEMPGSKVRLVRDSWRMLTGLGRIRRSLRMVDRPAPGRPSASESASGVEDPVPPSGLLPEVYAASPMLPRASA